MTNFLLYLIFVSSQWRQMKRTGGPDLGVRFMYLAQTSTKHGEFRENPSKVTERQKKKKAFFTLLEKNDKNGLSWRQKFLVLYSQGQSKVDQRAMVVNWLVLGISRVAAKKPPIWAWTLQWKSDCSFGSFFDQPKSAGCVQSSRTQSSKERPRRHLSYSCKVACSMYTFNINPNPNPI